MYFVSGASDLYSNSHISPKSDHLAPEIEENISKTDFHPINSIVTTNVIDNLQSSEPESYQSSKPHHTIVERSASPILIGEPEKISFRFKNNLDTNDIYESGKYDYLSPTKSFSLSTNSGEVLRAPRGNKALPLQEPNTTTTPSYTAMTVKRDVSEVTTQDLGIVPETPRGRQSNPDIQDIITGIVKLLNGNVNVQANTPPPPSSPLSRPHRPMSNRINNRGPPRISDLPTDFDIPSDNIPSANVLPPPPTQTPSPTKMPPPYPFERPQNGPPVRPFLNGIPVPEQIVPLGPHRPNRPPQIQRLPPPWHRRPQRPPQRFPTNIPPYKPLPPLDLDMGDEISLTSIEPANHENTMLGADHTQHEPENEDANIGQTEATYHDLGDQLMFHDFNSDTKEPGKYRF